MEQCYGGKATGEQHKKWNLLHIRMQTPQEMLQIVAQLVE